MDKQFENTYKLAPEWSDNPGIAKKRRFIEDVQIRAQKNLPNRPSNIGYFENLMYGHDFPKGNVPRVGYFCNMIPNEIIAAMGAEPVRLDCGNNAAALVGEEMLAGEICPLAKASFGDFLHEDSLANSCDVLVLPTSCDAKRKMGEVLNDFKPVFMFNLPPEQNHEQYAKQSYLEVLRLVEFLKMRLKMKLSGRNLRSAVVTGQKRTQIIRDIQEIRINKPRSLAFADFLLIIQASQFRTSNLAQWLDEAAKVRTEMEAFQPDRKSLRPRLVLTGAPMIWPNFKALNILEEAGADVVADTLCSGAQSLYDPVITDERNKRSLLRAIANRYVYASICPCFISQATRLNRILELAGQCKADGVMNYSLRLCQLFDVENYRIERVLKERKIPYMNVRSDYSLEDTEQLRVRIEAFLETL